MREIALPLYVYFFLSIYIEKIEEVPETLITLTNGKKYIVLETIEEVIEEVIRYKNKIVTYRL